MCDDITEALWGTSQPEHGQRAEPQDLRTQLRPGRNRPIEGNHPYVFLDGLCLKQSWGGVSLLAAIGVNEEGFREVLAVSEGSRMLRRSWWPGLKRRCTTTHVSVAAWPLWAKRH